MVQHGKNRKRQRLDSNEEEASVETHFKDLMEGCFYDWIDPHDCIPFTMTRPISNSGVLRLMTLFDGAFDGENINGGGICSGSDTPIVVKLDGTLLLHVCEHFRKKGLSEAQVKEQLGSRLNWYGIVDGEHSHNAIVRLIESKSRWNGYKWFVTVIKGGHSIEKYRQLARAQNERQSNRFHIELTFFDMLNNMKTEYEKLSKVQNRVLGQDVVNAYCGYSTTSKKNSTLVQTANTVMRLPNSVIRTIGEISNSEHPDLILSNRKQNIHSVISIDDVVKQEDCRIYRNFLHITTLKSSKVFMNGKHKNGERAQIYAIYRAQDIYKQRCFSKAVQPDELGKQYELALYSIEEEEKFLTYIYPDKWPVEMQNVRYNLLKTVQLSDAVSLNHGNKEVLPCLLTAYKRHLPAQYIAKQQRFELQNDGSKSNTVKTGNDSQKHDKADNSSQSNIDSTPAPPSIDESVEKRTERKDAQEKDTAEESREKKYGVIKEKGINCHNMKWQEFLTEIWSETDKRIDAIITEPPPSPSLSFIDNGNTSKEIQNNPNEETTATDVMQIVKDGKRFLKHGGYFIVLIQFDMFQHWYLAFRANGFNVMRRPLTFSYKSDSVPRRPSQENDFPYGLEEYCIVARLPGAHPDGFNPNFNSNFNLIECNWSRRASIVTNVEMPKNKLCFPKSRKPVRVSEKPINLLAEIIDLFVPPYGTTMDLFAGTMTLPIAALKTSRRCIAVESDKQCFELSIDRLASLCRPDFKFIVNNNLEMKVHDVELQTIDGSTSTEHNLSSMSDSEKSANISTHKASLNPLIGVIEDTSMDVDDIVKEHDQKKSNTDEPGHADPIKNSKPNPKQLTKTNDFEAINTLLLLNKNKT